MNYAKFVIFGAGVRAKRLFNLLGKDRIVAFVDNYPSSQLLFNKPVICLREYQAEYNEYVLIISPMIDKDIVAQLENEGIKHYLVYSDCPSEFIQDIQLASNVEKIKEYVIDKVRNKATIMVCGLSLFSIIVNEWLAEAGINSILNIENEAQDRRREIENRLREYSFCDEYDDKYKKITGALVCTNNWTREIRGINNDVIYNVYDLKNALDDYLDLNIIKFKNKHKYDRRCFIVATGPSLKVSDLDLLHENKAICFSMNKVFYAFDETFWRPDYYLASDPLVISACKKEILDLGAKAKFIGELDASFWQGKLSENIYKIHQIKQINTSFRFSSDLSRAFEQAHTTTFLAIQLAAYMGFKEIYLLGTDHTGGKFINSPDRHFYGKKDSKAFVMRMESDSLKRIESDYIEAEKYSREHGFRIFNASRGGNLEVFERVDIDELFEKIRKEKGLI